MMGFKLLESIFFLNMKQSILIPVIKIPAIIKALTLIQPWASLVRDKIKLIETRSWATHYIGFIAIHAGNKVNQDACDKFGYDSKNIERETILCIAYLQQCVKFPNPLAKPDIYGDFTPGRFGWILTNIIPLSKPIYMKGKQGLWNLDMNLLQL